MHDQVDKIFNSISSLNVLIIGDVMVDAYMWGHVSRISPEAPVPIVSVNKRENRLGGAANVALNVKAMGANPILCSLIGNDQAGKTFTKLLQDQNISSEGILISDHRSTTIKTRVIGNSQHIIRVDEEIEEDLNDADNYEFLKKVEEILKDKIDIIIIEDYDKGLLNQVNIAAIISLASKRNIPVCVDPKKKNFHHYQGASLFKPNFKELKEGVKVSIGKKDKETLDAVVSRFKKENNITNFLLTLSEEGIYYSSPTESGVIPAHVRNIADVSGAGDTVISIAALCYAIKMPFDLVAAVANLAGGLVCEKVGVVPIEKSLLVEEVKSFFSTKNSIAS